MTTYTITTDITGAAIFPTSGYHDLSSASNAFFEAAIALNRSKVAGVVTLWRDGEVLDTYIKEGK